MGAAGIAPGADAATLARQACAFELLATVFGQKPSEALLVALAQPEAARVFEGGTHTQTGHPWVCALAELGKSLDRDPAATLETLGDEYATLLERPGSLPAQPWGSCYLENDGALFGAETLAVRRAYAARGFLPSGYPHEADDHLAFELAFVAELTQAACDALDAQDTHGCTQALAERKAFVAQHMQPWVGRFAKALGTCGAAQTARLYPQAAAAAAGLLAEIALEP